MNKVKEDKSTQEDEKTTTASKQQQRKKKHNGHFVYDRELSVYDVRGIFLLTIK